MMVFGIERADLRTIFNFLEIGIRDRYLGSRLGMVWAMLNPVLMLLVFTLVVGFILKISAGERDHRAYARWRISAYGPGSISEALVAPILRHGAAGLVKNVAFKTEILPVVAVLTSTVTLAVTVTFLGAPLVIDGNLPTWHIVFAVPVLLVQYLFLFGVGSILATITVFYRDVVQVLPNLLFIIMLTSPILYPMEGMPRPLQVVSKFNPFYILTQGFRDAVIGHKIPDIVSIAVLAAVSAAIAGLACTVPRAKGQCAGSMIEGKRKTDTV